MANNVDGIKTNTPWQLKSRNESARKNMLDTPQKIAGGPNKNPGKASKASVSEGPTVDLIDRNPVELGTQSPTIKRTERKRQASPTGSSELYSGKSVKVSSNRNEAGRAGFEQLQPEIMRSHVVKRGANSTGRNAPRGGANIGKNAKGGIAD